MTTDVVVIVDRFPERSQTFVFNELRQLAARDVTVQAFAMRPPLDRALEVTDIVATMLDDPADTSRAGLVARLARLVPRWGPGPWRALRLHLDQRTEASAMACRRATDLVSRLERRPTRIHAHFANAPAGVAMFAGAITGSPWSFTGHAHDLFVRNDDLDRKLARADLVVDVCDYNHSWLREHHPHDARHVLVPCGIDLDALRRARPYEPVPFRVLAVGRLVAKKGFDDLVRATAILRDRGLDLEVRVLGDGKEAARLEGLVHELDLDDLVTFSGSVPPAEVRAALEDTSVLCLPCIIAPDGDRDSQPVVVKEAMAMEVPVVGSREVGMPEMVEHGITGLLTPPRDPMALADALADLAKDPDRCRQMGRQARRRAEAMFGFDTTIPRLLDAWGLG